MPTLADIKSKASDIFNNIGRKNGTAAPPSTENRASIAYEYFIADHLASMAEKRKKDAKAAAIEAGVFGSDYSPGIVEVYSNEHLSIAAKTNQPAKSIGKDKLNVELAKLIGVEKAQALLSKCMKEAKAATSYQVATK